MNKEYLEDAEAMAIRAADWLVDMAHQAVRSRNKFTLAISGGSTPQRMLELLSQRTDMPWDQTHLFQVDERIAPLHHPDRNRTMQTEALFTDSFQHRHRLGGVWWMPVERLDHALSNPVPGETPTANPSETEDSPASAALTTCEQMATASYLKTLEAVCGRPIVLDVVQLGLGDDGHTASLVPGDPICHVTTTDVGLTEVYKGRRRMTMTYPLINRARHRLWLTAATKKEAAIALLLERSPTIPAGTVSQEAATLLTTRR